MRLSALSLQYMLRSSGPHDACHDGSHMKAYDPPVSAISGWVFRRDRPCATGLVAAVACTSCTRRRHTLSGRKTRRQWQMAPPNVLPERPSIGAVRPCAHTNYAAASSTCSSRTGHCKLGDGWRLQAVFAAIGPASQSSMSMRNARGHRDGCCEKFIHRVCSPRYGGHNFHRMA